MMTTTDRRQLCNQQEADHDAAEAWAAGATDAARGRRDRPIEDHDAGWKNHYAAAFNLVTAGRWDYADEQLMHLCRTGWAYRAAGPGDQTRWHGTPQSPDGRCPQCVREKALMLTGGRQATPSTVDKVWADIAAAGGYPRPVTP